MHDVDAETVITVQVRPESVDAVAGDMDNQD